MSDTKQTLEDMAYESVSDVMDVDVTYSKIGAAVVERLAVVELVEALEGLLGCCGSHTRVFLTSREKMHPAGVELFDNAVECARAALAKVKADG